MKKLIYILQILVGLIFLLSFFAKATNSVDFFIFLNKLRVPDALFILVYLMVLTGELALGLHLLIGIHLRIIFVLSISIYTIFTFVLIYAYIKGINASCGCFGGWVPSDASIFSILRNVFLAILFILLYKKREFCYSLIKPNGV